MDEDRKKWSSLNWLRFAKACGYESGFFSEPFPELLKLEKSGSVERNPCADGHWRITEKGEHRHAQMMTMKVVSN